MLLSIYEVPAVATAARVTSLSESKRQKTQKIKNMISNTDEYLIRENNGKM